MKKYFFYIFIVLLITNLKAQEFGFSPVKIWSDNYEIQNPFGFSFYYFQPIGKLGVKLEYITATNKRDYYGYVISGFFGNPDQHIKENVKSETHISAFEFGLVIPGVIKFSKNYFNINFGVSSDNFNGTRTGSDSGEKINLWDETKFGIFYGISISRDSIFQIPLKLELLFKQKFLGEGNFATDIEQPFAKSIILKELHFNVSYVF